MLFSKNSVITLYHRTEASRTMKLLVDTCGAIGAARKDANDQWNVPCDIIGYNGTSKGRLPKVRFHPETLKAPESTLQTAICEAFQLLVEQFLGEWSLNMLYSVEDVRELQQVLTSQTGEFMFYDKTIVVNWVLNNSATPLVRRCSCLLSSLIISVSPVGNGGAQLVRLDTDSAAEEAWLEMQFALSAECTPISSNSAAGHRLSTIIPNKDSERAVVRLTLERLEDDTVAVVREKLGSKQVRPLPNCASGEIFSSMALSSIQLRIDALRVALDASISDLQVGKKAACSFSLRPCDILYQHKEKGTFVHISGSSPVTPDELRSVHPILGESVPELFTLPQRPLTVNVNAAGTNVPESKITSPSGSIDSGISSPVGGELSPLGSPKFAEYVTMSNSRFRIRSVSECDHLSLDSEDSMGNGSAADLFEENYQVDGLKSILKARRAPKLGVAWRRTMSECEPSRSLFDDLSCMPLTLSQAMSFDDEEESNYLSSLEELEETSDDLDLDAAVYEARRMRKKSVSFSEHVQKRCFRADASILAQKKRNEKKNRCRNRKSSTESIPEECNDLTKVGNVERAVALAH